MYLKPGRGYYRGTEQCTTRGPFLLLVHPKTYEGKAEDNTYAIVRKVALSQCGQFMMGKAKIGPSWVIVSGSYGNDGLPMDVDSLPADAVKLPKELYDAWNKGGGWNGPGSEAEAMRKWAIEQFKL